MSQNSIVIPNSGGAPFRQAVNNAFNTLVTHHSGPDEPTTTYALMLWADTTTGYVRQRNAANSAWVNLWPIDGAPAASSHNHSGVYEPVDADILRADTHDVLEAAFESNVKASSVSGNVTLDFTGNSDSNLVKLTLTGSTTLNGLTKTSGKGFSAIVEVVPGGNTLAFNTTYFKALKGSESPSTSKRMIISLYSGTDDYAWYMIALEP